MTASWAGLSRGFACNEAMSGQVLEPDEVLVQVSLLSPRGGGRSA